MPDIYHYDEETGEAFNLFGSVPIDDTQASEETVYSSAKVETMMEEVHGWKYLNQKIGNIAISLPDAWSELYVICRFGNSGGLQAQATAMIITLESVGLTLTFGGLTIATQVVVSAQNKINMRYFGVSGTDYTSTSQIKVYYR